MTQGSAVLAVAEDVLDAGAPPVPALDRGGGGRGGHVPVGQHERVAVDGVGVFQFGDWQRPRLRVQGAPGGSAGRRKPGPAAAGPVGSASGCSPATSPAGSRPPRPTRRPCRSRRSSRFGDAGRGHGAGHLHATITSFRRLPSSGRCADPRGQTAAKANLAPAWRSHSITRSGRARAPVPLAHSGRPPPLFPNGLTPNLPCPAPP